MVEIEAWVARDYNGSLYIYTEKPKKLLNTTWFAFELYFMKISELLFPEVKWEDEEPTKVKIIIDK